VSKSNQSPVGEMAAHSAVDNEDNPDVEEIDQHSNTGDLLSKLPPKNLREADVVISILFNG
jgi:hypothetical protein